MGRYRVLATAAVLTMAWVAVAAVCFSSIASVPTTLAAIPRQERSAIARPSLEAHAVNPRVAER